MLSDCWAVEVGGAEAGEGDGSEEEGMFSSVGVGADALADGVGAIPDAIDAATEFGGGAEGGIGLRRDLG